MTADILARIISLAFFAVALFLAIRMRQSKQIFIVDYQVGLRLRSDGSSQILPPGVYRSLAGGTPISIVDMRPRQFVLEQLKFQDILQANSVISVGGELAIRDPQLAVSAFKNLMDDSLPLVRERLLQVIPRLMADPSAEGREKMAASIATELNRGFESSGVGIQNLEITELWVHEVKHKTPSEAN